MYFDREKTEITLSKDLLMRYQKALEDRGLDLDEAINILLNESLRGDRLLFEDLLVHHKLNREQGLRESLLDLLDQGRDSLGEYEIDIEDMLMALGVTCE